MPAAFIGIGTNIGDRAQNVARALREISRVGRVLDVSPVYESAPVGFAAQDTFWNLVVRISTSLEPRDLLVGLKEIETRMGRAPTFRNGPRLIDLDIILYGDAIVDEDGLHIPHARALERAFVVRPLYDIAPHLVDPRTRRPLEEFLREVTAQHATPVAAGHDLHGGVTS